MQPTMISLYRKELFDEVWKTPILELCKTFNLSDNGLRKICKRYKIPTPPVGYWAKKTNGHKVAKPLLKGNLQEIVDIKINISPISKLSKTNKTRSSPVGIKCIIVPEKLIKPHPLISKTQKELSKLYIDKYGRPNRSQQKGLLDIHVTPSNLPRALRIMDAVLKEIENLGGEIVLDERSCYQEIEVQLRGETFKISIEDRVKQTVTTLSEKEKKLSPWRIDAKSYVSTDCLYLKIDGWRYSHRYSLADTKQKIEEKLHLFFIALEEAIIDKKRKRQIDEWRAAEDKKQKKIRQKKLLLEENEAKKKQALVKQFDKWQEAEKIRTFARHCMKRVTKNPKQVKSIAEFNQWVKMVFSYADSLETPLSELGIVKNEPEATEENTHWKNNSTWPFFK